MKRKLSALSGRYLAASKKSLKQRVAQRKTVEAAVKKSGQHCKALLEESLALQEHLRHLTHQILSAQDRQEHSICVILSGIGSDGTLGLRAIKEKSAVIRDQ